MRFNACSRKGGMYGFKGTIENKTCKIDMKTNSWNKKLYTNTHEFDSTIENQTKFFVNKTLLRIFY